MNILIVDDEKQLVDALSSILKQNNYSVDGVFDGETGLDYALSGIYDLIILDVMMPKMDGFTLLKTLRSKKIDTPILMLTAKSDVRDKIDYCKLCGYKYICQDANGQIWAYKEKPEKRSFMWTDNDYVDDDPLEIKYNLSFLSWDDEEPWLIE